MPTVAAAPLQDFAARVLAAAGTPEDIAGRVAFSLIESNLRGVDSHGILRLPQYVGEIAKGDVQPAARPEATVDSGAVAMLHSPRGFGIHAMETATETAIEKARLHHVAAVGLTGCSHTGRIGQFAEQAARAGLYCQIMGGGAHQGWGPVVPHGGARPLLGTNPYAFALPAGGREPLVVDFATAAAARGKISYYRSRKEPLPEGWLLDPEGRPSRDAEDLWRGGMQLPMAGHKGYGLGLVAEMIGYALMERPAEGPQTLNWLIVALDVAAFRPADAYDVDCGALLDRVKATPPAPGFEEVLLPGEPEARSAARRRPEGIPVPEATWQAITEASQSVGVSVAGLADAVT